METLVQAHSQAQLDFFMKGDRDSLRILGPVTDTLGRTPSDLRQEELEGFNSDMDLDAEVAAGLDTGLYAEADDEELALEEPFSALDLEDNGSGRSQSDSEDHASRTTTLTDGCQRIHLR